MGTFMFSPETRIDDDDDAPAVEDDGDAPVDAVGVGGFALSADAVLDRGASDYLVVVLVPGGADCCRGSRRACAASSAVGGLPLGVQLGCSCCGCRCCWPVGTASLPWPTFSSARELGGHVCCVRSSMRRDGLRSTASSGCSPAICAMISLISRSAEVASRTCSRAHLTAVARCASQTA